MSTVETRLTVLETEFRTELRHLATKSDLQALEMRLLIRLSGLLLVGFTVIGVLLRF